MVKPVEDKRGFTLVEMAVVVAVVGIVVMLAPPLIVSFTRYFQYQNAKLTTQQEARVALEIMNRFLRQAQASTIQIDQVSGQPPFSRIYFTTIEGKQMEFYQQNNVLYQVGTSTTTLSKNLLYMAFTFPRTDNPSILSVSITTSKSTYQGGSEAIELAVQKVRIMN